MTEEDLFMVPYPEELVEFRKRWTNICETYDIPSPVIGRTVRIIESEYGVISDMYETTVTGASYDGSRVQIHIPELVTSRINQKVCMLETRYPDEEHGQTGWVAKVKCQSVTRNNRMLQSFIGDFVTFIEVGSKEGAQGLADLAKALNEGKLHDMNVLHEFSEQGHFEEEVEDITSRMGTYYIEEIEDFTEDQIAVQYRPFPVHVMFI